MWTPRRIIYAILGFVVCITCYAVYTYYLGAYNGLPRLPEAYHQENGMQPLVSAEMDRSILENPFIQAFGVNCPEARRTIRLDLRASKNLLLAADNFTPIMGGPRDGWVSLSPVSVAHYGKSVGPEGIKDISLFMCDRVYVQFDRPVRSANEIEGANPQRVEMFAEPESEHFHPRKGKIWIINNRKTFDRYDDIEMWTNGPIYYLPEPAAGDPHIWTKSRVEVFDFQNTKQPLQDRDLGRAVPTVAGNGMNLYLVDEKQKKANIKANPNQKSASGLERLVLSSNVEVNLWTDGDGAFANGGENKPKSKQEKKPSDRKLMEIRTNGPLHYHMQKETAEFFRPQVVNPGLIERVTVARAGRTKGLDLLDCEYLLVKFAQDQAKAKSPAGGKGSTSNEAGSSIEFMKATGESITLTSDSEELEASGVELNYHAEKQLTVLYGKDAAEPMYARKGTNVIRAPLLEMWGGGEELREAIANGPGWIGIGEVNPRTGKHLKVAEWSEKMTFSKKIVDQKTFDEVRFIGTKNGTQARFTDLSEESPQVITADELKLLLWPDDPNAKPVVESARKKEKQAKPYQVEAIGAVRGITQETIIRYTEYLNVRFKDVKELTVPKKQEHKTLKPNDQPPPTGGDPKLLPPTGNGELILPPIPKANEPKDTKPAKKQPLKVKADRIDAFVNRDPEGNQELDTVIATGDVTVQQDPKGLEDHGTFISGTTVKLRNFPLGYYLHVIYAPAMGVADAQTGTVKFDKLTMFGKDIIIDQRINECHIAGPGQMSMLTSSDMEGKKLEDPKLLHVWWSEQMDFYGSEQRVDYHGKVKALQEDTRLWCVWMQVLLDRPVYLREVSEKKPGEKKENPKIESVVCTHVPKNPEPGHQPEPADLVTIIQAQPLEGPPEKMMAIQAPFVEVENALKPDDPNGPRMIARADANHLGMVRIFQEGSQNNNLLNDPGPASPMPKQEKKEKKLTLVQFENQMQAFNRRQRAKFLGKTRVLHLPTENHLLNVNLRELDIPAESFFMDSRESLYVYTIEAKQKLPDGKIVDVKYQAMEAIGNVKFRKQGEFFGDAHKVDYNEEKGTLTFHGLPDNPVVINKLKGQGLPTEQMRGTKIVYFLRTKVFEKQDGTGVSQ
ncbi:MAG: hypothetical protein R3B84_12065 [Zavarzinella sp.]